MQSIKQQQQMKGNKSEQILPSQKMLKSQDLAEADQPYYQALKRFDDRIKQSNQMLDTYRISTWNQRFQYNPLYVDQLKSAFLQDNEHYQACVDMILEYNQEVEKCMKTQEDLPNGPWKNKFYNQLLGLLREVLFTRERLLQKQYAQKVYDWAVEEQDKITVAGSTVPLQQIQIQMEKKKRPFSSSSMAQTQQTTKLPSFFQQNTMVSNQQYTRPDSAQPLLGSQTLTSEMQLRQFLKSGKSGQTADTSSSGIGQMRMQSAHSRQQLHQQLQQQQLLLGSQQQMDGQQMKTMQRPISGNIYQSKKIRPITAMTRPDSSHPLMQQMRPDTATTRPDSAAQILQQSLRPDSASGIGLSQIPEQAGQGPIAEINEQLEQIIQDDDQNQQDFILLQQDDIQKHLDLMNPSKQIEELMRDYETGARTMHEDCDPPREKLKEYKRHLLVPEFDKKKSKQQEQTLPKIDKAYDPKLKQDFLKMKQDQQGIVNQMEDVQEDLDLDGEGQQEQPAEGGEGQAAGNQQPAANVQAQNNIIPAQQDVDEDGKKKLKYDCTKHFLQSENGMDQCQRDLNKKFEQRSNYLYYEPSNDPREMRMEQKWVNNRNAEIAEKRQNEEVVQMLVDWSHSKARLQKEITRKIDSNTHGSQYSDVKFKPKHYSVKQIKNFEKASQALKDEFGNYINEEEEEEDEIDNKQNINTDQQNEEGAASEEGYNKRKVTTDQDEEQGGISGGGGYSQQKKDKQQQQDGNQNTKESQTNKKKSQVENDDEDFEMLIPEDKDDDVEVLEEDQVNPNEHEEAFNEIPAPEMRKNRPQSYIVSKRTQFIDLSNKPPESVAKPQHMVKAASYIGLEHKINNYKVEKAKQIYGQIIGVHVKKDDDEYKPVLQPSLSVFSKPTLKTMQRPFSAVFLKVSPDKMKQEQLDEIDQIKQRMASYNINVPIKQLRDAILIPDPVTGEKEKLLPEPGMCLLNNPLSKLKKKKKKKGKKGKKSKK